MGVLTDFFVATEDEAAKLTEDDSHSELFDTYQSKGVDTVKIDLFYSALTGRPFKELCNCGEMINEISEDGPWIFRLPSDLVARLSSLDAKRIMLVSENLASTEDFEGWSPEDVSDVLGEISAIALRAQECSKNLYHWVCI
jgi:hypothetical protein